MWILQCVKVDANVSILEMQLNFLSKSSNHLIVCIYKYRCFFVFNKDIEAGRDWVLLV